MANFCTGCGKEILEGMSFCTECGTPVPPEEENRKTETTMTSKEAETTIKSTEGEAPTQVNVSREENLVPPPVLAQQPQVIYQQDALPQTQPVEDRNKVVKTGTYFWLMFLFAIPILGWFVCILMAILPKNKNLKHFARAVLIWLLIGAIICVALFFLFASLGGAVKEFINNITGGQFGDLQDVFGSLKGGDLSSLSELGIN